MYKIHKQTVDIKNEFSIMFPEHSKIIKWKLENDRLSVWYEFKDNQQKEKTINYKFIFTGESFENSFLNYIDTFFIYENAFHLFQKE
jgi:hypothetical protein